MGRNVKHVERHRRGRGGGRSRCFLGCKESVERSREVRVVDGRFKHFVFNAAARLGLSVQATGNEEIELRLIFEVLMLCQGVGEHAIFTQIAAAKEGAEQMPDVGVGRDAQ